MINRSLTFQV
jgi:hypothetical protein